jgi:hypothetical protein
VAKKNADKELEESLKEIVGEELVEDALDIVEKTLDWYGGFSTSKDFDSLTKKQKDLSESVVVDFLGLTFYTQKVTPDKWTEKTLKTYCAETLPEQKFQQKEEYFKALSPVLYSFFNYLDKNNLLPKAKILAEKVHEMKPDFLRIYEDVHKVDYDEDEDDFLDSTEIIDEVYEWLLEFEKSEFYQKLSEDEQTFAEEVILNFTDFMYGFHHSIPANWSEESMEDCCVNTLPGRLPAKEKVFKAFYPVLSNFFLFLDEVKILKKGASLAKKLKKLEKKMVENANDPSNWELEKIMVMKAIEAGVDIHDEKAMKKYMDKFSQKIIEEFSYDDGEEPVEKIDKVPGKNSAKKVGRNDPCPCGSGKKYKKCHGAN